jgi:hypothetical protein
MGSLEENANIYKFFNKAYHKIFELKNFSLDSCILIGEIHGFILEPKERVIYIYPFDFCDGALSMGELILTTTRVLFISEKQNRNIPRKDIYYFSCQNGQIEIRAENRTKTMRFMPTYGLDGNIAIADFYAKYRMSAGATYKDLERDVFSILQIKEINRREFQNINYRKYRLAKNNIIGNIKNGFKIQKGFDEKQFQDFLLTAGAVLDFGLVIDMLKYREKEFASLFLGKIYPKIKFMFNRHGWSEEAFDLFLSESKKPLSSKWEDCERDLAENISKDDHKNIAGTYYQLAALAYESGKDFVGYLEKSQFSILRMFQNRFIKKVKIITDCCESCNRHDGEIYSIDEALEECPLPHKDCTEPFNCGAQGFCRCFYQPVL